SQWKAEALTLVPVIVRGPTSRVPRRLVAAVKRGHVSADNWDR
ncbi:MAG: 50S ribosomal protein L32, partial [Actinomycetota bacterium]|nr:50S ribosomal protein L32 [Actinomycetota bacterium]